MFLFLTICIDYRGGHDFSVCRMEPRICTETIVDINLINLWRSVKTDKRFLLFIFSHFRNQIRKSARRIKLNKCAQRNWSLPWCWARNKMQSYRKLITKLKKYQPIKSTDWPIDQPNTQKKISLIKLLVQQLNKKTTDKQSRSLLFITLFRIWICNTLLFFPLICFVLKTKIPICTRARM